MELLKRLLAINGFEKLILLRILILVILLKKGDHNAKIIEIEKKIPDHNEYIATNNFN